MLGLILPGLAGDRVVHEFEELFLNLRLGGGTEICVLGNVRLEQARLLELDDAVDLCQLHPMLDVELEVEVMGDIVDLVEETGQEFKVLLGEPS